jgi:hypothetical protein
MSREISTDFNLFFKFLINYKLSHLENNENFKKYVSQVHKKYFSYLTLIGELQEYLEEPMTQTLTSVQYSFLKESCSDIGNAIFVSFHGSYKAAKLILRSSIETFLKGLTMDELTDIHEETSMYEFFNRIKTLTFLKSEHSKPLLSAIHSNYKILCKDVHTANDINMAHISAMNYFPSYIENDAQKISQLILTLIPTYINLLCLKYNEQFHKFHYKNKDVIIKSVVKKNRPKINNIE